MVRVNVDTVTRHVVLGGTLSNMVIPWRHSPRISVMNILDKNKSWLAHPGIRSRIHFSGEAMRELPQLIVVLLFLCSVTSQFWPTIRTEDGLCAS